MMILQQLFPDEVLLFFGNNGVKCHLITMMRRCHLTNRRIKMLFFVVYTAKLKKNLVEL